jgi:putative transposase
MPRAKHYFEPGHFYHLTTRTLAGMHAFAEDRTKETLVAGLRFYCERGDWRIHAFVIMVNHVHLVVSAAQRDLGAVVGCFKSWTSHQLIPARAGALWERRFDDNAVRSIDELRSIVQYVHNNPVRIGLVGRAEDYPWSSARNYAGFEPVAMKVETAW